MDGTSDGYSTMKRTRTQTENTKSQRRRLTKRRGILARLRQLPEDLIGLIQGLVINTQIRLGLASRRLMNNPSRYWGWSEGRRMGSYIIPEADPEFNWDFQPGIRYFGWGGGGEFRGWAENIRRHLYARNVERLG